MRLFLLATLLATVSTASLCAQDRIVLRAGVLLDGKGGVAHNQQIVIEDGRIRSIGPAPASLKPGLKPSPEPGQAPTYDLSSLTVMPGWIDTHIHPQWHMDAANKAVAGGAAPEEMALYDEADVWMTLQAGFTTVQSVGSPFDKPVRDGINQGILPGPRFLTSLIQIQGSHGQGDQRQEWTPDELRELVRKNKADGADVIKLFATTGLGAGGGQSMTDAQIGAVCSEAKAQGLRSVVHAIGDAGARAAVLAGCTSIEHGTFLTDTTLKLMVERGTFFDPNLLVLHNYLDHHESYTFTDVQLKTIAAGIAPTQDVLRRARKLGVRISFGTDAVAGAHGRNAEEFIYRVHDAGETPMNALLSATSVSAASLGLSDTLGTLAPGLQADLVGLAGDPLADITAVRHVVFVMRAGKVLRNVAP